MMTNDWTTPEELASIAAEELSDAVFRAGIRITECYGDGESKVSLSLSELRDAETLMTLVTDGSGGPGSFYDRATGSCVSVAAMAAADTVSGREVDEDALWAVMAAGWDWSVHPHMTGLRMGWHVTVTLPVEDANAVSAALNARVRGVSL